MDDSSRQLYDRLLSFNNEETIIPKCFRCLSIFQVLMGSTAIFFFLGTMRSASWNLFEEDRRMADYLPGNVGRHTNRLHNDAWTLKAETAVVCNSRAHPCRSDCATEWRATGNFYQFVSRWLQTWSLIHWRLWQRSLMERVIAGRRRRKKRHGSHSSLKLPKLTCSVW